MAVVEQLDDWGYLCRSYRLLRPITAGEPPTSKWRVYTRPHMRLASYVHPPRDSIQHSLTQVEANIHVYAQKC